MNVFLGTIFFLMETKFFETVLSVLLVLGSIKIVYKIFFAR